MTIRTDAGSVAEIMESDMDLWKYWGFDCWVFGTMRGVWRKVTFLKPALIGEVARYYAIDTIVWGDVSDSVLENLWGNIRPEEDVMTQRFLFVGKREKPLYRIKSFFLGIKGYKEFHSYWPGEAFDRRFKDLVPLVDRAIALHRGEEA